MDEKTRNWLTEAFEEYTFNEIKRAHEIFTELSEPELNTEEDGNNRLALFEELQDLVDGIDNAKNLNNI